MPRTVLVFAAHPDDAEFFAGGTLAKLAREGASVTLAIATDGRKGSFDYGSDELARVRSQDEAQRAAAALGADPPILLGHSDLELDTLPPGQLREQFVRLIRQYRPDALFAHDPFARFETHPDHRAVAWAASDAVTFAALPLMHPEHLEQGLEPHFVVEKYWFSDDASIFNRVIDTSATLDVKLAALAEHKSQMKFLVEDVLRQATLAGLDAASMLGEAVNDPMAALAWAMQAQAAQIGQRIGVQFGEAFRYTRFHQFVETLLETRG